MKTNSKTLPPARNDRAPLWNTLNVLIAAQEACQVFGIRETAFSRMVANDPRLIHYLRPWRMLCLTMRTRRILPTGPSCTGQPPL